MKPLKPETIAARTGIDSDRHHGAVIPPLHLSATFSFSALGKKRTYDYTRSGNPTRDMLAAALAQLEAGQHCVVTSSGMAAVHLVTQLLSPDSVLLAPHDGYGGCHRLFEAQRKQGRFGVQFVDFSQTAQALASVASVKPAIVWLETPSNPLLRITDIRKLSAAAKKIGALVVVDNTFLSPVLQQPLTLGADIVLHSTTKYINGHSDVVGGAVICTDAAIAETLSWWANCLGITGAPFDAYQTLRGLRTIGLRVQQQAESAHRIANFLDQHPAVTTVHYPGLKTHPGHLTARQQQTGFGAIVSFELAGDQAQISHSLAQLRLFTLAESLGGVESLVAHPASMTHAAMPPEARAQAGIHDNLVRLSVGVEASDDLLNDLNQALSAINVDQPNVGASNHVL